MKKLLIICPTKRDRRELSLIASEKQYHVIFHDYTGNELDALLCCEHGDAPKPRNVTEVIDAIVSDYKDASFDGVVSTWDYPGSLMASVIAQSFNLPGASTKAIVLCQHKYYARCAQRAIVPEATPNFTLINPRNCEIDSKKLSYPVFLKPVKASFSIGAGTIKTREALHEHISSYALPQEYLAPFNWFSKNYFSCEVATDQFLAESVLRGVQVTLEGYVYNGCVHVLGVVDSVMFPETISFKRFEYPSSLSNVVQVRMADIARKLIPALGLDATLFNIEFMYDPQKDILGIIEVNPRMSPQFADLFEKVDGTNTYEVLCALATGSEPVFTKNKGDFAVAASFVLRFFENKKVVCVPTADDLANLYHYFPEARVELFATEGKTLAYEKQDGKSYRYGLVHLGGKDRKDLFAKYDLCVNSYLPIQFEDL